MRLHPFQLSRRFGRLGLLALLVSLAWAGHAILAAAAPPNFETALAAQYEMVAERPYDPTVQNDLGNLLMLADREDEAAEAYRRALEIDDTHRAARFNLGLLLQSRGEHSEAVQHFDTLLELDPRHAWAHYQKGVSHERLGQRKAAIRHYARAFALDAGLSFAENNPQIIDSELATEALLVSGRHAAGETRRVPRQYDDAERIAELMLQPSEATAVTTSELPRSASGAPDPEAPESEVEPEAVDVEAPAPGGGRPGTAEPVRHEREAESGEQETEEGAGEEGEDDERPARRVITADDLGSGRTGGVTGGGGDAGRPDLRQPTRRGVRTPRNDRPPSVTDRGSRNAPQPGTTRYRPSRRSSASLEMELLPVSETVSAG